jgi:hypothetical protein
VQAKLRTLSDNIGQLDWVYDEILKSQTKNERAIYDYWRECVADQAVGEETTTKYSVNLCKTYLYLEERTAVNRTKRARLSKVRKKWRAIE